MRQPCTRLPPAALKWMKKESRGQVDAANTKETRVKMKRSPDRVGTIQRGEEQPPPNIVIELLRGNKRIRYIRKTRTGRLLKSKSESGNGKSQ